MRKVLLLMLAIALVLADDEASSEDTTAAPEPALDSEATDKVHESTESPAHDGDKPKGATEKLKDGDKPASDCNTWPTHIRPLQECCSIPYHSNVVLQNICYTRCMMMKKNLQQECILSHYVNMTGLIRDGKLHKGVVKRIYENNAYSDRRWFKVIGEGVDKCEYATSGSLTQNLVKFYNCVNDFLADNCLHFIQSPECEDTEEHFESCKNIQPNCTAWPMNMMHPEACCKAPQLISEHLISKCRLECQRKELFMPDQIDCRNNCTYTESGLKDQGKFKFDIVKKMLKDNANKSEAWEKAIDSAVEACEKTMKGEI